MNIFWGLPEGMLPPHPAREDAFEALLLPEADGEQASFRTIAAALRHETWIKAEELMDVADLGQHLALAGECPNTLAGVKARAARARLVAIAHMLLLAMAPHEKRIREIIKCSAPSAAGDSASSDPARDRQPRLGGAVST